MGRAPAHGPSNPDMQRVVHVSLTLQRQTYGLLRPGDDTDAQTVWMVCRGHAPFTSSSSQQTVLPHSFLRVVFRPFNILLPMISLSDTIPSYMCRVPVSLSDLVILHN